MRVIFGLSVAALLLCPACASDGAVDETAVSTGAVSTGEQSASDAGSGDLIDPAAASDLVKDLELLASQERIRPANFYKLERSYEPAACEAALASLNKPYAVPDDLHTFRSAMSGEPLGKGDYAAYQAAYYLGTNDNVHWSWRKLEEKSWENGPNRESGVATLDFFNDGVNRFVTRTTSSLSDHLFTLISVRNPPVGPISFGLPKISATDLPDKDRLNTKLTYSTKDIIKINGKYYTLLLPVKIMFSENYVYLFRWRGAPYTGNLQEADRRIICVFSPSGELSGLN